MRSDEQLPETRDLETANVSSDPLLIQLLKKRNLKYMQEKKNPVFPFMSFIYEEFFSNLMSKRRNYNSCCTYTIA